MPAPAPAIVLAAQALGEHARNDMAGDEPESWKSIFREAGFEVDCHLEGLGMNPSWADIYVEHLTASAILSNLSLSS